MASPRAPAGSGSANRGNMALDSRETALAALSEREFQALVVDGLKDRGYWVWHVVDSRLMAAGLPDLLFYHPERPGVLFAWELKRQRGGVVSTEQATALDHLRTVPGIDARIVRPADWDVLKERM
jgi:hypothetical protein